MEIKNEIEIKGWELIFKQLDKRVKNYKFG